MMIHFSFLQSSLKKNHFEEQQQQKFVWDNQI